MPNRIIKESICTSDTIESLTWFEEVLFYRLLVKADDYGRYEGRAAIIKGTCFPLKDVTVKDIEKALNKLSAVGLVNLYRVHGKPYLQLVTWGKHQQIRAKKSKYPQMDEDDIICNQLISDDCNSSRNPIQSESNPNPESKSKIRACAHDAVYFPDYPELNNAFSEFVKMRKAIKAQMTEKAVELKVKKLTKMATVSGCFDERMAVEIVNQSVENSWKDFYPLKEQEKKPKNGFRNFEQRDANYNETAMDDMKNWFNQRDGDLDRSRSDEKGG